MRPPFRSHAAHHPGYVPAHPLRARGGGMRGWDAESWGLGRVCGGHIGPPASPGMHGSGGARKQGGWGSVPRMEGAEARHTDPPPGVRGRGEAHKPGANGLAHAEGTGGWGAWGWAGIAHAEGTEVGAPSLLLRAWAWAGRARGITCAEGTGVHAGRGEVGAGRGALAGLASPGLKGLGYVPSPPVARAGRGGAGRVGWASVSRAEGARGAGVYCPSCASVCAKGGGCDDGDVTGTGSETTCTKGVRRAVCGGRNGAGEEGAGVCLSWNSSYPRLTFGTSMLPLPLPFPFPLPLHTAVLSTQTGDQRQIVPLPAPLRPPHGALFPLLRGQMHRKGITPAPLTPFSPANAPHPTPTCACNRRGRHAHSSPLSAGDACPPAHAPRLAPARAHPGPFSMGNLSPAHASRPAPTRARNRRDGVPTPVPSAQATPAPQLTRLASPLPARTLVPSAWAIPAQPTCPAPPLPRTQQEGRHAHSGPLSAGDACPPAHTPRLTPARACKRRGRHLPWSLQHGRRHTPCPPMPTHATGGRARPPRSPQHGRCQPSPMHPTPPSPCMPGMQEAPRPPPVPSAWAKPSAPGLCASPRPRTPGGGSPRRSRTFPAMQEGRCAHHRRNPAPSFPHPTCAFPRCSKYGVLSPPVYAPRSGEMRARGKAAREEGYTARGVVQPEHGWRMEGSHLPRVHAMGVQAHNPGGGLRVNGRVGASERGYEKEVMACPRVYAEGRVL
ncbi:hypothetical protein EDB83DRAFT_2570172 [Lactarius deliciosus]|nr:hypothetical protein EDB83DRAFT_2570172 [Lactarius deliciosus]